MCQHFSLAHSSCDSLQPASNGIQHFEISPAISTMDCGEFPFKSSIDCAHGVCMCYVKKHQIQRVIYGSTFFRYSQHFGCICFHKALISVYFLNIWKFEMCIHLNYLQQQTTTIFNGTQSFLYIWDKDVANPFDLD